MTNMQQIGRLAMRVEGNNWNAYYALNETMEGALFLGSLQMGIARIPERKQQFLSLMRDAVADILEDRIGERPEWNDPVCAPEHERAGRG